MKHILLITALILSLKAQAQEVIISLSQMEECMYRPNHDEEGCPDLDNATYVKDIGNRLDQYVGVWKGNLNGKNYEFHFEKKIKSGEWDLKWDYLIGRFIVKDSSGSILYNSLNKADDSTMFWGKNFQKKAYMMSFVGNSACNEFGTVFLSISNTNPNSMRLGFEPDQDIYDPAKCPNFSTYVYILPSVNDVVLTKQ